MASLAAAAAAVLCCLAPPASASFVPTPFLPPLLTALNGSAITAASQWPARRAEVSGLLQQHILGSLPTGPPPPLTNAEVLSTAQIGGGSTSSMVRLHFDVHAGGGEKDTVAFVIEILRPPPAATAGAKLPIFLTQWTHRQWALVGLNRGYVSVVYPGADQGTDAAPLFQEAYPTATMALILARAFVASRTLDYVLTLPGVNTQQVSITGHSRNGKQSLVAAAFDTRITAVVGSSPGAPISSPYRFGSANFYGEGPVSGHVEGNWWLASIKQYAGHEERLPIDGHGVLAMIAPRAAAIGDGWQDHEGCLTFADEANVVASAKVSERFPLIPLHYWLFTPELQWQPRGKMAHLTGVQTGNAHSGQGLQAAWRRGQAPPDPPPRRPPRLRRRQHLLRLLRRLLWPAAR